MALGRESISLLSLLTSHHTFRARPYRAFPYSLFSLSPLQAALSLFFNENAILPQVSAAPPVHPGPGRSSSGTSAGSAHSLGMRVASYVSPFPLCGASSSTGSKTPFHSHPKTFACFQLASFRECLRVLYVCVFGSQICEWLGVNQVSVYSSILSSSVSGSCLLPVQVCVL